MGDARHCRTARRRYRAHAAIARTSAIDRLRLTLLDLAFDHPPAGPEVVHGAVDLADPERVRDAIGERPIDALFHLASIPGGTAERQYGRARAVNVDATLFLLELCKSQVEAGGPVPRFVFASSIAAIGAMPAAVDDDTPLRPQMTYGAQKVIGEVLVDDFSRRGWADGRSLRLPGVLARPPARTGQLSAFLSDLLRELAAGRPFTCPTSPGATTWASSLPCVVDNLLHGASAPAAAFADDRPAAWPFASTRAVTLPTLRFSMAAAVDAIAAVCGSRTQELVQWTPDERIEALFGRFPPLSTHRADAIGFRHDGSLEHLVRRSLGMPSTETLP